MDNQSTFKWVHGVVALSVSLVLLGIAPRTESHFYITNFICNILYIPEYPALVSRHTALDFSGWYSDKNSLITRINGLTRENEKLRMLNAEIVTQKILIDETRDLESAKVILRAPTVWWNEIRINAGKKDGLTVGGAVFKEGYLVGRISFVEEDSARVELITSSSLMLPAVVEETRDIGVICGDGEGNVWLQFIPENRGIEREMNISTALVGDKLPSGLRIGKISEESSISPNGFHSIRINIGADMSRLYSVDYKKITGRRR
ncbi:MAG: rod shape-determining protein MreC [Synergistaceae bacterium]|nr:rod shape-determining protein MreC [Synergistaceae bacterium]